MDQVYLRDVLTRLPLQKNHQNGRAAAAQREAAGLNIRPTNAVPVKVYFPDANEQQLPLGQEGRQPGQDLFHDVLWHGNCESFRMGKIPSARDREHDGDAGQPVELAW